MKRAKLLPFLFLLFAASAARAEGNWISLKPDRLSTSVKLQVGSNQSVYYLLDQKDSAVWTVQGSKKLKVAIRLHWEEGLKWKKRSYILQVLLDGKPIMKKSFKSRRAENARYLEGPNGVPGWQNTFFIEIPEGEHQIIFQLIKPKRGKALIKMYRQRAERHRRKQEVGAEFSLAFDDNILQYSDTDQDEFKANTNPARFAIKSIDDTILIPELAYRSLERKKRGSYRLFEARLKGNFYVRNSIKNYLVLSANYRSRLNKQNAYDVGIGFIPEYYLRHLSEGDETPKTYKTADFRMLWGNLGYEQTLGDTKLKLRYQAESKDYNQNFNERDLLVHLFHFGVRRAWNAKTSSWLAFEFELGDARAKDADPVIDPDTSYRQMGLKLGSSFKAEPGISGSLSISFFRKSYMTNNSPVDDPFHAGRDDDIQNIRISLRKKMKHETALFLAYEFEKKDSNIDVPQNVAKSESLSYTNNSVSLGLQYEF